MTASASIPQRFNGPPASGNGGYSCGILAAHIDGAARVRLHVPPPLETDFSIQAADDGSVTMYDGDTLVGTAVAAEFELDCPPAPTLQQAMEARHRSALFHTHPLPSCFVCGTERTPEDGLCLHPGPVDDWNLLACEWQPTADLLDDQGNVREEIIWSALDCPGYNACYGEQPAMALLGELTSKILTDIPGNDSLIVYCWPLGREGRKGWGGTAIANQSGDVLAYSRSLWIELKK
jgi:hypothetical protein